MKMHHKKILAYGLIIVGTIGTGLTLGWLGRTKPTTNGTPASINMNITGQLYILQRNTPTTISALGRTAELTSHNVSNISRSSVIQFTNSDGIVVQTVTFTQLGEVQVVDGRNLQLRDASVDAVQIVVK